MKTYWMAVALLCIGFVSGPLRAEDLSGQGRAEAAGRGLIGSPAPRIVLKTIDGQTIDLGRLYGKKAVYLKFWETWCAPCREQMPHFEQVHKTAGLDLAVIAVDTGINDPIEDIRKFSRKVGMTMPIVVDDGRLAEAFNLRVTPQHVVIGRDGRIQYMGHLADKRLEAALLAARSPTAQPLPLARPPKQSIVRYRVGDRLPDLTAVTLDGKTFHARDPKEQRPTVLVFLSVSCESYLADQRPKVSSQCRQVREQTDSLAKTTAGVRWMGVASSLWTTQSDLRDYAVRNKPEIPLALDESGQWFRSFDVLNVPTLLIADARGQIVRRMEGFDAGLSALLQSLAAE